MIGILPALATGLFFNTAAAPDEPEKPKRDKPVYELKADHDPNGTGKFYMGREIALVMGYQAAGWLERPERVKEEEPAKLFKALDLQAGNGGRRCRRGAGTTSSGCRHWSARRGR